MAEPAVRLISLSHMPLASIYTRLGYREGYSEKNTIHEEYEPRLKQWVASTQVRIFYVRQPFELRGGICRLGTHEFSSRLISERFAQAQSALLMAASADPGDVARIQTLSDAGNLQDSVILDAVLSEKTDFALDFIETEMAVSMRREGLRLGPRLSCGYSDFKLENQRYFFETLQLGRHGIDLDSRFIFRPEKTVTALAPVLGALS